jgi:CRP-like cAMP-binding protein
MISPELLRRFPFFAPFSENQLKEIALISAQDSAEKGTVLFEQDQPANTLFLLVDGGVDLYYTAGGESLPRTTKEFSVGEINPGEIFGISALVEPCILSAAARLSQTASFVRIDAAELRKLLDADPSMGYAAMQQVTKVLYERLEYTRVQLAACWA